MIFDWAYDCSGSKCESLALTVRFSLDSRYKRVVSAFRLVPQATNV
jgi:hypothetical protein